MKNHSQTTGSQQEGSPRAHGELSASEGTTAAVAKLRIIVIAIVLIVVAGAALAVLLTKGSGSDAGRPVPKPSSGVGTPPAVAGGGYQPQPGEMLIPLAPDRLANAHLKTEAAEQAAQAGAGEPAMRTTGTVQSNAYREVPVLPIAGGIVREVQVRLGDRVTRGQTLATVFSTDLADAQSAYLRAFAEYDEHHKHHRRATELVELGASSREELEAATSRLKSAQADVAMARQRLELLGLSDQQVDGLRDSGQVNSIISVASPIAGTIINRTVNQGEVVAAGKELFRVADLSTVWVIGQVYESDFRMARIGMPATITTQALPGRSFTGRIEYVDARVDPQTRTAQVRIEAANRGEVLRLGMFVDVTLGGSPAQPTGAQGAVAIPRGAVQYIGSRPVVYVATTQQGVFAQREITAGPEINGLVAVSSGLSPGEQVVTDGSFLLRAESLKLDPGQLARSAASGAGSHKMAGPSASTSPSEQLTVTVEITDKGYNPASFTLRRGVPARLVFVRRVEQTCGTAVVIPDFNIKRELPMNEPVTIELTPEKKGEYSFTCGMNMLSGKIIVR